MSGLESLLEQTHAKAELQLCCWGHGGCCPSRGHSEGSWPRGAGGKGQLWDGDPLARVYLQLWDAAVDEMGTVSCVGNAVQGKKKKKQPARQWRTCGLGMHGIEKVEQEGWWATSW